MEIYSLDNLSLREIRALRTALDAISITGIDAAFIALLQHKVSSQIQEIENHLKNEEKKKDTLLDEAIAKHPESNLKKVRGKKKV